MRDASHNSLKDIARLTLFIAFFLFVGTTLILFTKELILVTIGVICLVISAMFMPGLLYKILFK